MKCDVVKTLGLLVNDQVAIIALGSQKLVGSHRAVKFKKWEEWDKWERWELREDWEGWERSEEWKGWERIIFQ